MHVHDELSTEPRTEKRARVRARLRRNRVVAGAISVLVATGVVVATIGSASADPSAGDWQKLRNCESGGNYAINTGNGYYGAYQFDLGTWRSVGGSGLPSDASPATQDALAYKLWQQRGWSPWACASIVGLPEGGSGGPAPKPAAAKKVVTVHQIGGLSRVGYNMSTGKLTVQGWAADVHAASYVSHVKLTINGKATTLATSKLSPSVNKAHSLKGTHAFTYSKVVGAGTYKVCASITPKGSSPAVSLGCKTVKVATVLHSDAKVAKSGTKAVITGWAFDSTASSRSVGVTTTINGVKHFTPASRTSAIIAKHFAISGKHGFRVVAGLHAGRNTVCVSTSGIKAGTTKSHGCKTITIASVKGGIDSTSVSGRTVTVRGWAVDPNATAKSVPVKVVVNNGGHVVTTREMRPNLNAAQQVSGRHGFTLKLGVKAGSNKISVYSVGTPGVPSKLLATKTIKV